MLTYKACPFCNPLIVPPYDTLSPLPLCNPFNLPSQSNSCLITQRILPRNGWHKGIFRKAPISIKKVLKVYKVDKAGS